MKKQRITVLPLGVKRSSYELNARAALLALEHNTAKQQHLIDLYCLAKLCEEMTVEQHIKAHFQAVDRLCEEIHKSEYKATDLQYLAMAASIEVLLEYFNKQPNALIARSAIELAERMAA